MIINISTLNQGIKKRTRRQRHIKRHRVKTRVGSKVVKARMVKDQDRIVMCLTHHFKKNLIMLEFRVINGAILSKMERSKNQVKTLAALANEMDSKSKKKNMIIIE